MNFLYSLKARICLSGDSRVNIGFAFFEKFKIMFSPVTCLSADDLIGCFVCYDLGFDGMLFLFSAVIIFLFFLGRSIGDSVTSINTSSKLFSGRVRAFLPGK